MTSLQEMPVRLLNADEHESTVGACQLLAFDTPYSPPSAPECALASFLPKPTSDRLNN
jgi:hypothetical protein